MMLFKDVYLSSHLKMCIYESLLVFMHSWSVLFDDVVFDDGVDEISNIPLMSKIFDDSDRFGTTCIYSQVRDIACITVSLFEYV